MRLYTDRDYPSIILLVRNVKYIEKLLSIVLARDLKMQSRSRFKYELSSSVRSVLKARSTSGKFGWPIYILSLFIMLSQIDISKV